MSTGAFPGPLRHFQAQLADLRSGGTLDMDQVGRLLVELAADQGVLRPADRGDARRFTSEQGDLAHAQARRPGSAQRLILTSTRVRKARCGVRAGLPGLRHTVVAVSTRPANSRFPIVPLIPYARFD